MHNFGHIQSLKLATPSIKWYQHSQTYWLLFLNPFLHKWTHLTNSLIELHKVLQNLIMIIEIYVCFTQLIIICKYLSFENRSGYKSKHLRVSIAVVEELRANRHKQMLPLKQSCWWLSKLQRGQFSPRTLENAFFFWTYKK